MMIIIVNKFLLSSSSPKAARTSTATGAYRPTRRTPGSQGNLLEHATENPSENATDSPRWFWGVNFWRAIFCPQVLPGELVPEPAVLVQGHEGRP